ncbi:tetratricopeptide repeat protein [Bradyrhizobium yuanmingense]|uniref:tetratricopeptide repeat protein n=1 Tax=Bradyrhizobium yuanmingense TaxID=108015 RepID=UPI000FE2C9B1|nr:tetratricopeptide repeat protein [Bradyrhizobium yuanmingense]TGN74200.1 tetratricopeptide repeat protein [Bradyrhizobium yuanmingense]
MNVSRRLFSLAPKLYSAVLASNILLLGGCASSPDPSSSSQQERSPELLGDKEIHPAIRERIAYALQADVDEQTLRETLKLQPGNVNAAIPLARALLARQRPDEALDVLDKVLLAAPADLRALNAKGVVLDSEGHHREAQALYRQALATTPDNPMLSNNLKLSLALDEEKAKAGNVSLQPFPPPHQGTQSH